MRKTLTLIGILALGLTFFAAGRAEAILWIDEVGHHTTQPWHGGAGALDTRVGTRGYVEIWNDSPHPVDISGFYISDTIGASLRWAPAAIPPWGFWVVVEGAGTDGLGAGAFSNTLYSFAANRVRGDDLALFSTDMIVAISTADTGGFEWNLDTIIDAVIYSNRDGFVAPLPMADVNRVIDAGHWDLWGTGSDADNFTGSADQQPSVNIGVPPLQTGFIYRIARDAPYDTPAQWEAMVHPNAPHSGDTGRTIIPEPATMILLGLGLSFLGFKGLKKKKA